MFYLGQGLIGCALVSGAFAFNGRWSALLPLLYIPFHIATWREMVRINQGRALNKMLGKTSRNMILLTLLMLLTAFPLTLTFSQLNHLYILKALTLDREANKRAHLLPTLQAGCTRVDMQAGERRIVFVSSRCANGPI